MRERERIVSQVQASWAFVVHHPCIQFLVQAKRGGNRLANFDPDAWVCTTNVPAVGDHQREELVRRERSVPKGAGLRDASPTYPLSATTSGWDVAVWLLFVRHDVAYIKWALVGVVVFCWRVTRVGRDNQRMLRTVIRFVDTSRLVLGWPTTRTANIGRGNQRAAIHFCKYYYAQTIDVTHRLPTIAHSAKLGC